MDQPSLHRHIASFRPDREAPGLYLASLFTDSSWDDLLAAIEAVLLGTDMEAFWAGMGVLQFLCSRPDHVSQPKALEFTAQARDDGRIPAAFSRLTAPVCLETREGPEKLLSILQSWPRLAGLVSPAMLMPLAPVLPEGFPLLVPSYFLMVVRRLAGDDFAYLGQLLSSSFFPTRLAAYQTIVQGSLSDPEVYRLLSRYQDPHPLLEPFRLWLLDWVSVQTLVQEMGELDDSPQDADLLTRYSVHLDPAAILNAWFARIDPKITLEAFLEQRLEAQ